MIAHTSSTTRLAGLRAVAIALACVLLISGTQFDVAESRTLPIRTGVIDELLIEQLEAKSANDTIGVIVEGAAPVSSILTDLRRVAGRFEVTYTYRYLQAFSATLTKAQIEALSRSPLITEIAYDMPVRPLLDTARVEFGVDAAIADYGFTGDAAGDGQTTYGPDDIVVAVIDTGIDDGHVDLDGDKILAFVDCTDDGICDPTAPIDPAPSKHGTHVASIIAGEGDGVASLKGVAPGAALVGVRTLGTGSTSPISWTDAGIEWVMDNAGTYGIDAMNLSLGGGSCTDGTDTTDRLVNQATAAGIAAFVAAGNSGPSTCTVGSPGSAKFAITLGAMADPKDVGGSLGPGFHQAFFSSRGPTGDGRIKPDLSAAGVDIRAAAGGTTDLYSLKSGTSMATPFAAGVGALMLQADPSLAPSGTPCETSTTGDCADGVIDSSMVHPLKDLLASTAQDWGPPGKDIDYGSGRLDAHAAVTAAAAASGGTPPPVPDHGFQCGELSGTGDLDTWELPVATTAWPLAVTLIMPGWSGGDPEFVMELRDPSDGLIAASAFGTRQEEVTTSISATGTYALEISSDSGSGPYFFDTSGPTMVTVDQYDTGDDSCNTTVTEGAETDSYRLALTGPPSSPVTVTPTAPDQVTIDPSQVTFTPEDWGPMTLVVTAIEDDVSEDPVHTTTITHAASSDDPDYDGTPIADVVVSVIDNTPGVVLTESSGSTSVSESGASDSYSLHLRTIPSSPVTITVNHDPQVTVDKSQLTFTQANYATPQVIDVGAIDDAIDEPSPHFAAITHAATSSDLDYDGIAIDSVSVAITDNDTAGVSVVQTGGSTTVGETDPKTDTYSVSLTSEPTVGVTITPSLGSLAGDVTISPSSYSFDAGDWATPKTFTITSIEDTLDEGEKSGSISHSATSDDLKYDGIAIASVMVTVLDNDITGYVLDGSGGVHTFWYDGSSGPPAPAKDELPYWPGKDFGRALQMMPDDRGGYVLDLSGGVHPFSVSGGPEPPRVIDGPYWAGRDIARALVMLPNNGGGYLLDMSGGIHPFRVEGGSGLPPAPTSKLPYWAGRDIARALVMLPNNGGGYLLDMSGGIHPFSVEGGSVPPKVTDGPYWSGGDVVRDLVILPNNGGGYLLDRSGGIHPFNVEGGSKPPSLVVKPPYFAGLDRARALVMADDFSRGYLADSRGGLHPFSFIGPPPPTAIGGPIFTYDIARTAQPR